MLGRDPTQVGNVRDYLFKVVETPFHQDQRDWRKNKSTLAPTEIELTGEDRNRSDTDIVDQASFRRTSGGYGRLLLERRKQKER